MRLDIPVALLGIALVSIVGTGCTFRKKVQAAALPAPSQGALTKPAPVLSIPPTITPIETPVEEAQVKPEELPPAPEQAPPLAPKPPAPRRPRPSTPLPVTPAPETVAPAPEPGPQLRELLTPGQQAQYESELERDVKQARLALNRALKRKLTPAQRDNVGRIQTFLTQAQASRKDDLGTSLQLARRAALLGQELMKSFLP